LDREAGGYILVLDSDPSMTEALRKLLRKLGRPVESAHTLEEAMDAVRRLDVALIIADVETAGFPGSDFLERIRGLSPGTSVVALGAWPEKARRYTLRNGCTFFSLNKPAKMADILAVVGRALTEHEPGSHRPAAAPEG